MDGLFSNLKNLDASKREFLQENTRRWRWNHHHCFVYHYAHSLHLRNQYVNHYLFPFEIYILVSTKGVRVSDPQRNRLFGDFRMCCGYLDGCVRESNLNEADSIL